MTLTSANTKARVAISFSPPDKLLSSVPQDLPGGQKSSKIGASKRLSGRTINAFPPLLVWPSLEDKAP